MVSVAYLLLVRKIGLCVMASWSLSAFIHTRLIAEGTRGNEVRRRITDLSDHAWYRVASNFRNFRCVRKIAESDL